MASNTQIFELPTEDEPVSAPVSINNDEVKNVVPVETVATEAPVKLTATQVASLTIDTMKKIIDSYNKEHEKDPGFKRVEYKSKDNKSMFVDKVESNPEILRMALDNLSGTRRSIERVERKSIERTTVSNIQTRLNSLLRDQLLRIAGDFKISGITSKTVKADIIAKIVEAGKSDEEIERAISELNKPREKAEPLVKAVKSNSAERSRNDLYDLVDSMLAYLSHDEVYNFLKTKLDSLSVPATSRSIEPPKKTVAPVKVNAVIPTTVVPVPPPAKIVTPAPVATRPPPLVRPLINPSASTSAPTVSRFNIAPQPKPVTIKPINVPKATVPAIPKEPATVTAKEPETTTKEPVTIKRLPNQGESRRPLIQAKVAENFPENFGEEEEDPDEEEEEEEDENDIEDEDAEDF
jgi:hypothetical protein